jgi:hypothetical protein
MNPPLLLDVIGDVHGHLGGLTRLCGDLGYAVEGDWSHPDGRLLLFVGDLVDRGPNSLETAELVAGLVDADRALCLLGNHEYNLVGWHQGHQPVRPSNRPTVADIAARPDRWQPVLAFFASLPIAVRLPGLRVIHAVWHADCMARVAPLLTPRTAATHDVSPRPIDRLRAGIVLGSPFRDGALVPDLPDNGVPPGADSDHEILIKGYEEPAAEPFDDPDGQRRDLVRVCWWQGQRPEIPRDGVTVFGHYWCLPPSADAPLFAPPHPSGHPDCLRWEHSLAAGVPGQGRHAAPADERFLCIDYNGMLRSIDQGCVGAYRWPEHELAWAVEPAQSAAC